MALSLPKQLGTPEFEHGYVPFVVAIENKTLNLDDLDLSLAADVGVSLRNGRLPDKVGAFYAPKQGIGAADHMAMEEGEDGTLILSPISKKAVPSDNLELSGEGVSVYSLLDGRLRIVSLTVSEASLGNRAKRCTVKRIGDMAVVSLGVEAVDLEIVDTNTKTGVIVAEPRVSAFAFPNSYQASR